MKLTAACTVNLVGDLTIEELSPDYLQMSGKYTQLPYPAVEGFDMQWYEPTARFYLIVSPRPRSAASQLTARPP